MTPSTVPGIIAWPSIAFMSLVLIGRVQWCDNNLYERYFNNTLTFLLLAQLLREHLVQDILVRTSLMTLAGTWQLSTAVLGYSFTEFIGFTQLWSGKSESETRRTHRYYRVAAVLLAGGFLIAGTSARVAEEPIEFLGGWDCVVTLSCATAMLVVLAARLMWNSLCELRIATRRRERLIATSTLLMGLAGIGTVLQEAALQISDQRGWTHTIDYRRQCHAVGLFFMILSVFVTAAVPLAMKVSGLLGLDPTSRRWSKLQPLRQAMRTVVPDCAFDLDNAPGRRKSELQLHHTVVEIRDAIVRLRPFFSEVPENKLIGFCSKSDTVPPGAAIAALRLAQASRAKFAGARHAPQDFDSELILAPKATTLEEEAAELLELAKWWPAACAATEHPAEPADAAKVSSPA